MSTPAHWAELFGGVVYLSEGAQDIRFLLDLYYSTGLGEAVEEAGIALPIRAAQRIWWGRERGWQWRFDDRCEAEPRLPHFTVANVYGELACAYGGLDEVAAEEGTYAFLGRVHHADSHLNKLERGSLREKLTPEEQDSLFEGAVLETLRTLPEGEDWTRYLRRNFYDLAHLHIFQEKLTSQMEHSGDEATGAVPDFSEELIDELVSNDLLADVKARADPALRRAIDAKEQGRALDPAERQALSRFRRRLQP